MDSSAENYTDPQNDQYSTNTDSVPQGSQPRATDTAPRSQTQTRPTASGHAYAHATQHAAHQAVSSIQRTHPTKDSQGRAKPEDLTNGGTADVGQIASNATNKFEDDAEQRYERKAEASFARAENGIFEEGDKVYGCMENIIAKWWNDLINGKKKDQNKLENHASAPQPSAATVRS